MHWTARESARNWSDITSSSDGAKLAATVDTSGYIYTSADSGATWTAQTAAGLRDWSTITSSDNGGILYAGVYDGSIHVSSDSGATWRDLNVPPQQWFAFATNSAGTKLLAAGDTTYLYTGTCSP